MVDTCSCSLIISFNQPMISYESVHTCHKDYCQWERWISCVSTLTEQRLHIFIQSCLIVNTMPWIREAPRAQTPTSKRDASRAALRGRWCFPLASYHRVCRAHVSSQKDPTNTWQRQALSVSRPTIWASRQSKIFSRSCQLSPLRPGRLQCSKWYCRVGRQPYEASV